MAKLISLSGIHNCGKTTTFNKLKEHYKDNNKILFISEVNTALNDLGLGINNDDSKLGLIPLRQTMAQTLQISMEDFLSSSIDYTHVVLDRCSLDTILYTVYFADRGDIIVEEKGLDSIKEFLYTHYKALDIKIFYFGIDKWIENKRKDSMDKESGTSLDNNYFGKLSGLFTYYSSINDVIEEIDNG